MTRIEKFDRWVARHVVVHPVHFYGIRNICENCQLHIRTVRSYGGKYGHNRWLCVPCKTAIDARELKFFIIVLPIAFVIGLAIIIAQHYH
jgi:hypothetical protein